MTVNTELLQETLDFIKANPQKWDQDYWRYREGSERCNTTMCFAGHAVTLDGCRWAFDPKHAYADYVLATREDRAWVKRNHSQFGWGLITDQKDRSLVSARIRAQRVLGLSTEQANLLFSGSNNLSQLENIVYALIQSADQEKDLLDA